MRAGDCTASHALHLRTGYLPSPRIPKHEYILIPIAQYCPEFAHENTTKYMGHIFYTDKNRTACLAAYIDSTMLRHYTQQLKSSTRERPGLP